MVETRKYTYVGVAHVCFFLNSENMSCLALYCECNFCKDIRTILLKVTRLSLMLIYCVCVYIIVLFGFNNF